MEQDYAGEVRYETSSFKAFSRIVEISGSKFEEKTYVYNGPSIPWAIREEIAFLTKISEIGKEYPDFADFSFQGNGNELKLCSEYSDYSLSDYLKGPMDYQVKLHVFYRMLEGFALLEANNMYHGNVNPSMILIKSNKVFLAPFLPSHISASLLEVLEPECFINCAKMYQAPEVLGITNTGQNYGLFDKIKADVYSLGLCFYQLFTEESILNLTYLEFNQGIDRHQAKINNNAISYIIRSMLTPLLSRPNFKFLFDYYSRS